MNQSDYLPPCLHGEATQKDRFSEHPSLVPLLKTKLLRLRNLSSMYTLRIQPVKSVFETWNCVGRLGTPPIWKGPVRSRKR